MGPDKTEHLRRRLAKWCEIAIEKITEDAAALEMHSAVRNVMRLFDRIKDYEKRVLAKRGSLCAEDQRALLAALGLLARVLIPFAPHAGEELAIAVGGGEDADVSWPEAQLVAQ
jgi:leucyl-tRNA synthetase